MKKAMKWVLALLGILLGIYALIFGFGFWAAYETGKRLDIGRGVSTNPHLVRLEIGDKVFAIPQNHIWSREDWNGGKVEGVNLQALLPDFEPYTEANRQEFDKPGWNRKMSFLLTEHNITGSLTTSTSMTRREVYERNLYDYSAQRKIEAQAYPGPYGLTVQQRPPKNSDFELYVGQKRKGEFYWVECYPDQQGKFPSCHTYVEYSKQVTIRYTFAKSRLSDWQAIDDGVLNLIHQFETNANQGSQK